LIKGLSSYDVVQEYRLGTSANVQKIKKALLQKELIDDSIGGIYFIDLVYQLWFQKNILLKEIIFTKHYNHQSWKYRHILMPGEKDGNSISVSLSRC
jgi:hypothetical protein